MSFLDNSCPVTFCTAAPPLLGMPGRIVGRLMDQEIAKRPAISAQRMIRVTIVRIISSPPLLAAMRFLLGHFLLATVTELVELQSKGDPDSSTGYLQRTKRYFSGPENC